MVHLLMSMRVANPLTGQGEDLLPSGVIVVQIMLSKGKASPFVDVIKSLLQAWKFANVTPIFKTGSESLSGYYSPISLTIVVGRPMGTICRYTNVNNLQDVHLHKDSQYGF